LTFQGAQGAPSRFTFTLLTPRVFRDEAPRSRLFAYKFRDYKRDLDNLIADLEGSKLDKRDEKRWMYPELGNRLERLTLRWVAYEDLFACDEALDEVDVAQTATQGTLPTSVQRRMLEALSRVQIQTPES
jgi:hypothetical protein